MGGSQATARNGQVVYNNKTSVRGAHIMSSVQKIKRKHFANPFPDFTPAGAAEVLNGREINPACKLTTSLQEKWESATDKFEKYLKKTDTCVYTGTSGVAMLLLLKDPDNVENLKKVKNLLNANSIKSKRRLTFLCGDGGPLALGAIVAHRLGDQNESKSLIKGLLSLKADAVNHKSDLPNEYLYGRAGYLFSLLYVNKHISPPPIEEAIIKSIIEAIVKSGIKLAKEGNFKCPLMYEWHDSYYLGAAHGVSGIIYLLLLAKQYLTSEDLEEAIKPTIDYLATLQFPSGNYPSSFDSQSGDKYVQWCHGSPGFVFMFCMAYKVFGDVKYLNLALKASDVVWERGLLRKGYSICHGVSGNAYCFLELYQTTNDVKHLYRAARFAEWCMNYTKQHEEYSPDRPLSLYEGLAGPMYLLLDIQKPMEARFPGFSL